MSYDKSQNYVDRQRGVFRVRGVCFECSACDSKIARVLAEASFLSEPGLMTREALCLYIDGNVALLERMIFMPIGSTIKHNGITITRLSHSLYNGKS